MPCFAENYAKWAPQGDPKILKNLQKSSEVLPKVPPGKCFTLTLKKKHEKVLKCVHFRAGLYAIRIRLCSPNTLFPFLTFAPKCIEKTSQMLPLDTFWAPLGTQMLPNVAFKLFSRQPQKSYFFEGVPMLSSDPKCFKKASTSA